MNTLIKIAVVTAALAAQAALAGSVCTVSTYWGTYTGYGYDEGAALADARNQCIRAENNGQSCVYAPYSCYDDGYGGGGGGGGYHESTCTVSTAYGAFHGSGYSVDAALADARNECIRSVGNARICMAAPYTCKQ